MTKQAQKSNQHNIMAASAEMPYFIKPSIALGSAEKKQAYEQAINAIDAILMGEKDTQLKMVSINCLLKTYLPYFYWVGFYVVNNGRLSVGPYQGTLGCLHIEFGKGVCGKVAVSKQTEIVKNTHALVQGAEHIACDPNSLSEIVLPVFNKEQELIAVFDVDATLEACFDEVDQLYLEQILNKHFAS